MSRTTDLVLDIQIKKAPCKNCKKRHIGCHSKCKEYNQYVEVNKKEKEKIRSAKLDSSNLVAGFIPRKRKR